jgi:hypothetical protein
MRRIVSSFRSDVRGVHSFAGFPGRPPQQRSRIPRDAQDGSLLVAPRVPAAGRASHLLLLSTAALDFVNRPTFTRRGDDEAWHRQPAISALPNSSGNTADEVDRLLDELARLS